MASLTTERIRVRLRVKLCPENIKETCLQKDKYFLAVSGSNFQLGFYDFNRAPRLTNVGQNIWTKDLWIMKNSPLDYKYLIIRPYTNEVLHSETIGIRKIHVEAYPLITNDVYNRALRKFDNRRNKQRTRPNTSGINTVSQRKIYTKPENQKENGVTLKQEPDEEAAPTVNVCERVAAHTKDESQELLVPINLADVDNKVENATKEISVDTSEPSSVSKDDIIDCEIEDCQTDDCEKKSKFGKYAEYMKIAAKVGLAAVAVFGVYKVVVKR